MAIGVYKRDLFTEEHRKNLSLAAKKRSPNFLGKHHSEESKKKISLSKIGVKRGSYHYSEKSRLKKRLSMMGKKSPSWKGGITPLNRKIKTSFEYRLWRKAVFERDRWTCIWCGYKGSKIEADHIKPFAFFPELRFAIDNGRTLCHECHRNTDTWGYSKKRGDQDEK